MDPNFQGELVDHLLWNFLQNENEAVLLCLAITTTPSLSSSKVFPPQSLQRSVFLVSFRPINFVGGDRELVEVGF